ncbi:MAG: CotH kinase family protein [Clostridium sp.]|uniref:CotH kinase family protein n=1 Tax=Clostridium sp. TaxID=1506 RepID=UPI0025BF9322|nr:CotH kinase family protein [Clostridium sp.]MBS4956999.1 CotH kinase family protein [Clostridium sp.]
MISNKHFNKIVSILISIAVIFSLIIIALPKSLTSTTYIEQPDYITAIFDDDKVIEINIEMDETAWQEMLDNAYAEEYTAANVTINGTTYNNVAIRPKGNSSLSQLVTDDTTDRYSFKIKFDEYVDGQTLDGLSKLVLNNNMSDATYMKEYLSYKLLASLGVPTPECAYAHITINGEEWGLYLAVEPIEEEFIARNYGSTDGNLYKPESDSVAVGENKNTDDTDNNKTNLNQTDVNESQNTSDNTQVPSDINNGDSTNQMQTPPNMNSGDRSNQMQDPPDMNNGDRSNQMQSPPDMNNGDSSNQMQTPPNMNNGDNSNQMQDPPDMNNRDSSSEAQSTDNTTDTSNEPPSKRPNGMGGGMMGGGPGGNSNGADLVWSGDDISNYSAIFDNAIFKNTDSDDYTKILDMIEHLDSMEDIESYLDVDEVLRYFAANTFLVNLDSYVSNMNHNYYLYENDGVVSILPWDYNLSFAGFQAGSASNAINFPIDSPVSDSLEDNPLIANLLEVDEYKELYHQYLDEILNNFINNGTYETLITETDALISDYVKNDATAFYTFDEYEDAVSNLLIFGYDRATSIAAQLDGTQPSTTTGTIETTVDLTAMGQQGGGGGNDKGGMNNMGSKPDDISQLSYMQLPNQDTNIKDFKNTNLAMGPNYTSSNYKSLTITLSSIALLVISIPGVLLFKKRKYIS